MLMLISHDLAQQMEMPMYMKTFTFLPPFLLSLAVIVKYLHTKCRALLFGYKTLLWFDGDKL